jgi:cellulose synthase/poly-beta-1,6-N-acetylglucosamine synthase-like glycosyltransferase
MIALWTGLYVICAGLLALYTAGQGVLLLQYLRQRVRHDIVGTTLAPSENTQTAYTDSHSLIEPDWPHVTVQLPLYNEQYVAARLLDAVAALDYPADKLHIQILDDSNDATSRIIAAKVAQYKARGVQMQHMRRIQRTGYKAGALQAGLQRTDSPFVAIFDADFIPPPDFLRRTLPYFLQNPQLGLLQARWGHLNPAENWLTRAQRLSIDAHFVVEQTARHASGWLTPFNGSAGVWRVASIQDAGGWLSRTLTEDFDLSYRAQLRGWQALYLPHVVVPAELPTQMSAYRQQQARWAVGSTQCLVHLLPGVWRRAARMTPMSRFMASLHLAQYLPQPLILLLLLLTPLLAASGALADLPLAPLGIFGLVPPLLLAVGQMGAYRGGWRHLLAFPLLVLLATGRTWSNTRAILLALRGGERAFLRTPKHAATRGQSAYTLPPAPLLAELSLALYGLFAAWVCWLMQPALVPYMLLYAASYAGVAAWEWSERARLDHHAVGVVPDAQSDRVLRYNRQKK